MAGMFEVPAELETGGLTSASKLGSQVEATLLEGQHCQAATTGPSVV